MLRFNKRMYYFEVDPSPFIFFLPGTGCRWSSHSNHAWSERSTQRVGLLQALGEPGFTSPLREMPMEKGTCPQAYFPRHQSIYAQSFKHISMQSYPRTNTTNKERAVQNSLLSLAECRACPILALRTIPDQSSSSEQQALLSSLDGKLDKRRCLYRTVGSGNAAPPASWTCKPITRSPHASSLGLKISAATTVPVPHQLYAAARKSGVTTVQLRMRTWSQPPAAWWAQRVGRNSQEQQQQQLAAKENAARCPLHHGRQRRASPQPEQPSSRAPLVCVWNSSVFGDQNGSRRGTAMASEGQPPRQRWP